MIGFNEVGRTHVVTLLLGSKKYSRLVFGSSNANHLMVASVVIAIQNMIDLFECGALAGESCQPSHEP